MNTWLSAQKRSKRRVGGRNTRGRPDSPRRDQDSIRRKSRKNVHRTHHNRSRRAVDGDGGTEARARLRAHLAPPGATHSGPAQRPDIQGLRALAVTLVVLGHAGVTRFSGGYVGVDVFFVISGFLITSSLLRELSATDRISIRAFYARRALRLLPASALVVLVTLAGSWLFLSKVRFAEYMSDAFASAVYAVNFRLAATGTDYLAEGSPPSPFQHFWSLAVEEQFYLLWPLLLLLGWRLSRRRRALLAVPLVALWVVSFGLSVYVTGRSAPWAYFGSHTRAWELGAGALVALALLRPPRLPAGVAVAMTWAGLACVIAAALRFDADTPFLERPRRYRSSAPPSSSSAAPRPRGRERAGCSPHGR